METVGERWILNEKVDVSEKVKFELLIEGCSQAEPARQNGSPHGMESMSMGVDRRSHGGGGKAA